MDPTAPPSPAPSRTGGHPPDLLAAEQPYIIGWGTGEALLAGSIALAIAASVAALGFLYSTLWLFVLVPVVPVGLLCVLFFRNPRRRIPAGPGLLVAPADGTVTEAGTGDEPEYIGGRAAKVAIFLSIFDVHLNRAPCSGKVEHLRHKEGKHLDARDPRAGPENESQAIGIRRSEAGGPAGLKVLVRQVSGAIARRIVCPLAEGQDVERGRLIGMIKYGSRTELAVADPPGGPPIEVLVRKGDKVRAGETPLLRLGGAGEPLEPARRPG